MSTTTNTVSNDGWSNQKEITIRFSKKLMDGPFEAKDGKNYVQVSIPNKDPEDKNPWASFILREGQVHENADGTKAWAAIPADGITTLQRDVKTDNFTPEGKPVYKTQYRKVSNQELKDMVESYRSRNREDAPRTSEAKETKAEETKAVESKAVESKAKDAKGKGAKAKESVLGKLNVAKEAVANKVQSIDREIPLARAAGAR